MLLKRLYDRNLSHASSMLGCGGEAGWACGKGLGRSIVLDLRGGFQAWRAEVD